MRLERRLAIVAESASSIVGRRRWPIGRRSAADARSRRKGGKRQGQARRGAGRAPIRCRCWRSTRALADVPVYLDGVGTARALNTVTVQAAGRRQADRDLVQRRPGRAARATCSPRSIPTTYQAQYDQAVAKKAQDEAQLANARLDLERYTRLAATNADQQAAGRHPARAGRAARGAGAGPTRPRSTTRARSCPTPTSSRRSPAAPASGRSTKATSCAPPTPPASSSSRRSSRSRCSSTCRSRSCRSSTAACAEGPLPVEAHGRRRHDARSTAARCR